MMTLKILLPSRVLVDEPASRVRGEAINGSFVLEPRHIDFVTALAPGILSFDDEDAEEVFIAVDGGILVKKGAEVVVSTRHAVRGTELGELRSTVRESFRDLDEREKKTRSAMARLEADFVRGILNTETTRGS